MLNLEAYGYDEKQVFFYDYDTKRIQQGDAGSHLQTLKEVIETIKRDSASQGGKQKIYLFCCFCLGGIAPSSRESVVRCCDPSSIDAALPGTIWLQIGRASEQMSPLPGPEGTMEVVPDSSGEGS